MYSLESPHWGSSNEYTQHNHYFIEDRRDISKLAPFASWHGVMINTQLLELLMSRKNSMVPKMFEALKFDCIRQSQFSDYICRLLFLYKLSIGKKFICKVERLNVKQRRSWWDGSLSGSTLFASLFLSPVAMLMLRIHLFPCSFLLLCCITSQ